jgi:glycine cleavage system H lipoate-binding protein/ABC-type phosphate transport system substrate-binding protein
MKTRITLLISLVMILGVSVLRAEDSSLKVQSTLSGSIVVYTSPDLYDLTTRWAGEFTRVNPQVTVRVSDITDNNPEKILRSENNISIISAAYFSTVKDDEIWKVVVGRDVVVPVINPANPYFGEISRQGVSAQALKSLLEDPAKQNWGTLLGGGHDLPLHLYLSDDGLVSRGLGRYIGADQQKLAGLKMMNEGDLVAAVRNDPNAIGFCNLSSVTDPSGRKFAENIRILPIDRNANGRLDYMEDIYATPESFTRGVWIGKYPNGLCSNIFTVSQTEPTGETEVAFTTWLLTDGQRFLGSYGYSDLGYNERQIAVNRLSPAVVADGTGFAGIPISTLLILVFSAILILSVVADFIVRRIRNNRAALQTGATRSSGIFDEQSVLIPGGLFFDKSHTWAFMEESGSVKVGIDDFLQHITGPITRIEMKRPGEKVRKGEVVMSVIQKGKQLNIYSPVTGTILESNSSLSADPSALNRAPFADGWVYRMEPVNWLREIQFMNMADKYRSWIREEFVRFRDFLAQALQGNQPEFAKIVLQDGGALKDHLLAEMGPEVWEDFQTKFIDTSR